MKCGLLGRKLGHSYSPAIHALLGDYEYALYEKEPDELASFLCDGDWTGINVTIPYKQAVIDHLDEVTPIAKQLGAVNTILRQIPHLGMLRQHHLSMVGLHAAHDALHQRGFTGTILTGKGNAVAMLHNKGKRIEQHARAELDVQVLYSKNHRRGIKETPALPIGKVPALEISYYFLSILFQRSILRACSSKRSAQSS